jgi:antitoxin ParD1/3/4/toxin ParE1/3/4
MSDFVLHPDALKDLEEIWEYIAADSLDAADRVREEIYDAIQSLVPFPHVGHNRSDLTSQPLRFQTVRDYVIAYAPAEKPLAIVAILHGRRSPRVVAAILRRGRKPGGEKGS